MISVKEKGIRVYRNSVTDRQHYTPISIKYEDVMYYEEYAGDQVEVPEDRGFTVLFLTNGDNLILDVQYEDFDTRCTAYDQEMFNLYKIKVENK